MQQLAVAFGRVAGCVSVAPNFLPVSALQPLGPELQFDVAGGENGSLQELMLDIDQMCEELGSRTSP